MNRLESLKAPTISTLFTKVLFKACKPKEQSAETPKHNEEVRKCIRCEGATYYCDFW